MLWGAFSEAILIIANIGTATAMYTRPQAAVPEPRPQLRRRPGHGVRLHRRRHPGRPHRRHAAAGLRRRRRPVRGRPGRRRRRVPRHAGVDVQPRPRLRRRRRQRLHPRLHDVPHRPGAPPAGRCSVSSAARSSSLSGSAAILGLIEPGGAVQQLSAAPGVLLGARPRHLPHRQGLQDPRHRGRRRTGRACRDDRRRPRHQDLRQPSPPSTTSPSPPGPDASPASWAPTAPGSRPPCASSSASPRPTTAPPRSSGAGSATCPTPAWRSASSSTPPPSTPAAPAGRC